MSKGLDDFEITIDKNTCSDGCMCEKKLIKVLSDIVEENVTAQKIGCHSLGGKCRISFTKAQKYKAIQKLQVCLEMVIYYVVIIIHIWT